MTSGRVKRQYSPSCTCSSWQLSNRCPGSKSAMPFAASSQVGCTKPKFFGFFRCFEPISKQQYCFETNRNNPKFSEKYQNMLSMKLLRLVFCLFRFNRNIESPCCSTETNCFETNRTNPKQPEIFWQNTKICSLSNWFGCSSVFFGSIETLKLSVSV